MKKRTKKKFEKRSFPSSLELGGDDNNKKTVRSRKSFARILRVVLLVLVLACAAFAYYGNILQVDEYSRTVSYSLPSLSYKQQQSEESRKRLADAKLKNERTKIELERIRLEKMKAELSLEKEKAKRAQIVETSS